MRLIIAGSSGMLGKALASYLKEKGYTVLRLLRGEAKSLQETPHCLWWDPSTGHLDPALLKNADIIINLSGDPVFDGRWTMHKKGIIRNSRIDTTTLLSEAIARVEAPPSLFINASAVGVYGSCGDLCLSESSSPGEGFLADVVQEWEQATRAAQDVGVRVICLRIGTVLSATGGA